MFYKDEIRRGTSNQGEGENFKERDEPDKVVGKKTIIEIEGI